LYPKRGSKKGYNAFWSGVAHSQYVSFEFVEVGSFTKFDQARVLRQDATE
jgi:hypothetical protein